MNEDPPQLHRGLAVSPFLLALVLFALPWVKISCAGIPVAELTGVDLATGTHVSDGISDEKRRIPADWRAQAALIGALTALGAALLPTRVGHAVLALIGVGAATLLLLMLLALNAETRQQREVPLSVKVEWPYWATLLSFATGGILSATQPLFGQRRGRHDTARGPSPRGAPASPRAVASQEAAFCGKCGAPTPQGAGFCGACGQRLG
jgi:hypothetical protein